MIDMKLFTVNHYPNTDREHEAAHFYAGDELATLIMGVEIKKNLQPQAYMAYLMQERQKVEEKTDLIKEAISRNTNILIQLNGQIRNMLNKLDELIQSVEANTRSISQTDATSASIKRIKKNMTDLVKPFPRDPKPSNKKYSRSVDYILLPDADVSLFNKDVLQEKLDKAKISDVDDLTQANQQINHQYAELYGNLFDAHENMTAAMLKYDEKVAMLNDLESDIQLAQDKLKNLTEIDRELSQLSQTIEAELALQDKPTTQT